MSPTLYYGTRQTLERGEAIPPLETYVYFTPNLDGAIWAAELSEGVSVPRVYTVATTGPAEDAADSADYAPPPHPSMSWRSRQPLTVLAEITKWSHYHGTRANLRPGELIEPGHAANFGSAPRAANYVYFTRTLDAAIWGAELAAGKERERIYEVEPTGDVEDDPNLTNARFKGNPTKSFRSRAPLRVVAELETWVGHDRDAVQKMKEGLARLQQQGIEPNDD